MVIVDGGDHPGILSQIEPMPFHAEPTPMSAQGNERQTLSSHGTSLLTSLRGLLHDTANLLIHRVEVQHPGHGR